LYRQCHLCPRRCGVDRLFSAKAESGGKSAQAEKSAFSGKSGYCGESAVLRLACASIHRGEEPPLTGGSRGGGSGAIFVSGCNLGCVFCQNWQISAALSPAGRIPAGRPVTTEEFARICLALQSRGAENINIVTGSHAVPALAAGIAAARTGISGGPAVAGPVVAADPVAAAGPAAAEGPVTAAGPDRLRIPVLWNSSAYELPKTLELLSDTVDVFLPDLKTVDSSIAGRYFNAPDYPAVAKEAIRKMTAMRSLRFAKAPLGAKGPARMVSGVMVRHLVLPGHTEDTRAVLHWFADHCAGRALLSVMFQYTPMAGNAVNAGPDRGVTGAEYERVLGWLEEFGIEDGYCQEPVPGAVDSQNDDIPPQTCEFCGGESHWLPDFARPNPFPSELSVPVWHWRDGFV
jgi:putative pyruvate formate lyase activating enzyme